MSKGWDNAMLKKLRAFAGKGLSTAEIGKKLGVSKNAVVGKLNRLGWNTKAGGAPADRAEKTTEKKQATPKATTKKAAAGTKRTTGKTAAKTMAAPKKTVSRGAAAKKTAPARTTKTTTVKKTVKAAAPKKPATPKKTEKVAASTPAKPAADKRSASKNLAMHQRIIQHSLEMANMRPNQCRWPIGDPDSENFHFCGEQVFVGKPYCYEHCRMAYQFTPPKKK